MLEMEFQSNQYRHALINNSKCKLSLDTSAQAKILAIHFSGRAKTIDKAHLRIRAGLRNSSKNGKVIVIIGNPLVKYT